MSSLKGTSEQTLKQNFYIILSSAISQFLLFYYNILYLFDENGEKVCKGEWRWYLQKENKIKGKKWNNEKVQELQRSWQENMESLKM